FVFLFFRSGSIVTNSSLEFSANGTIPTDSTVKDALVNATTTNSSLNIIPNSINVTQAPVTNTPSTNTSSTNTTSTTSTATNTSSTNTSSTNTTSKNTSSTNTTSNSSTATNTSSTNTTSNSSTATNTSSTNTTSTNTTSNTTTPTNTSSTNTTSNSTTATNTSSTNTSSTNTTSTSSTNTTTPVVAAVFNLVFSISETFDAALANTSSPQFAAKASSIRNQLEPIYRQIFKNFLRMIIHSFRSGSIVTNSSLEFSANSTIPTDSTVKDALVNATTTNSSLNILTTSINVTQ
ncbi:hypothetical protein PGIGA_G00172370, partial [Pangasianodon gigas]|nr:hypothetical protein [Pangasianodon gigas]